MASVDTSGTATAATTDASTIIIGTSVGALVFLFCLSAVLGYVFFTYKPPKKRRRHIKKVKKHHEWTMGATQIATDVGVGTWGSSVSPGACCD